ncbi:dihydroneopterin aldolase [Megasphaera hominis]|jgi:dihydroneopterin aldolase|uniref:7,8-dihydroneopterin aldolase n=2 Tax=Megasphaera TaxID=906 RepID=A0ABR6VET5_9FIRM|nr:dihydroneopterin aldolase [Megasphaera hominis]MBC3535666.1 dihydroneopterin aldolase [Megasphaera hominis]
MDKIVLKGLHFYGYHGVFPEETRKGQPFSVDVTLEFDASRAEETDSINETVDYSAVYGTIQKIVEGDPYKLIEKVAAVIARAILAEYSLVQAVEVTLHKPQAPIDGHFDDVLFVIRRERS